MYEEELFKAVKNNDIEKVKKLVEYGTDINDKNYKDETALFIALEKGYLEIVKHLVEHGADVNAECYDETALMIASEKGYLEIVKYLVEEKGMDINHADDKGWTALTCSITGKSFGIFKYLVEHGANINVKDKYGKTVLDLAFSLEVHTYRQLKEYLEIVKYLLDKDVDINVENEFRLNDLIVKASGWGDLELVKCLLDKGVDINSKDSGSDTALMRACYYGKLEVVKYLIKNGADVNIKNDNGKTALNRVEPYIGSSICIIGFGEEIHISRETIDEIVKILIEAGAK